MNNIYCISEELTLVVVSKSFSIFRCVVTTDNLIADVDGEVIQGEVQCQVLCNSLAGSWFNFKKGDGCQILRFCNEFQSEPGVTTGPNMPPIDSCQKPSPIPKAKIDFWYNFDSHGVNFKNFFFLLAQSANALTPIILHHIASTAKLCPTLPVNTTWNYAELLHFTLNVSHL